MDRKIIGKRMEIYRQSCNLSKAEMSRLLTVNTNQFGECLRGTLEPSAKVIMSFIEIFHEVSAEWLLRGNGPMIINEAPSVSEHYDVGDNTGSIGNIGSGGNGDSEAVRVLSSQLAEASRQIVELSKIVAESAAGDFRATVQQRKKGESANG